MHYTYYHLSIKVTLGLDKGDMKSKVTVLPRLTFYTLLLWKQQWTIPRVTFIASWRLYYVGDLKTKFNCIENKHGI